MLQKGSEGDDSGSKNSFPDFWHLIQMAAGTILPILIRLAYARLTKEGTNPSESVDRTDTVSKAPLRAGEKASGVREFRNPDDSMLA